MISKQIKFHRVQLAAMQTIITSKSPVIIMMITGENKSLLFILPVFCSRENVSVMMILLIAL